MSSRWHVQYMINLWYHDVLTMIRYIIIYVSVIYMFSEWDERYPVQSLLRFHYAKPRLAGNSKNSLCVLSIIVCHDQHQCQLFAYWGSLLETRYHLHPQLVFSPKTWTSLTVIVGASSFLSPFDQLQEKGLDSVVDCVYGLAVNAVNIKVISWTTLTLYVMSDCQIWYSPCYDHDISHICG